MREAAYAKLNLALHVRGRQSDGYHQLETLFVFCEDGDLLSVEAAPDLRLSVTGPFAADVPTGRDNLAMEAVERLRERFGVGAGAHITLDKRLPVASGIGGGSADAAAALRLLTRFWHLPEDEQALFDIAGGLGSDVPACLLSRASRGEGRGERLVVIADEDLTGTPVLLVNPRVALSTRNVFAHWDGQDRGALLGGMIEAGRQGRNDLEPAARALVPEIGTVLDALRACPGTLLVRMSGSGATCFALFDGQEMRDAAAAQVATHHSTWWQLATRLR